MTEEAARKWKSQANYNLEGYLRTRYEITYVKRNYFGIKSMSLLVKMVEYSLKSCLCYFAGGPEGY